ncbi:MAG: electron transport complex subunit RsxG [Gammaproteobacteria bacterium]|nr:electron transport complex subunit RsxG [Gammaproteobacteria bacterium]
MSRVAGAVFLVALATVAAALLAWMYGLTRERIENNELEQRLRALRQVLPADAYDNEPHLDVVMVADPELLGSTQLLPAYRARSADRPVAAVLTAVAPNGYASEIRLLVGIGMDGRVVAVRVTSHSETPGLGDRIEAGKSDWIDSFSGMQTENPLDKDWVLHKDGGIFDHMTGATITSHSVVTAVRNAVIYFNANREALLAAVPAG